MEKETVKDGVHEGRREEESTYVQRRHGRMEKEEVKGGQREERGRVKQGKTWKN